MKDMYDALMGFKPEDIRIFLLKRSENHNGILKVTHIPSGTTIDEELLHDSTDWVIQARDRLLNRLKIETGLE